jgi:hypothetical protein
MNDIELQDREFFAGLRVLDQLEQQVGNSA